MSDIRRLSRIDLKPIRKESAFSFRLAFRSSELPISKIEFELDSSSALYLLSALQEAQRKNGWTVQVPPFRKYLGAGSIPHGNVSSLKAEVEKSEEGFIDGYAVKCPTHGWFEFSDTVRATRESEPRAAWENALTKARFRAIQTAQQETLAGKRPRILDSDF